MSWYDVTGVRLQGPMIFTAEGITTPLSPDGDGVLVLDLAKAGAFVIADASVVKGIRLINKPPLSDDGGNVAESCMFMLQAADGGLVTIVHESLDVTEPSERINVNDGASTLIDDKRVQVFYESWRQRTRVHDWAGV